MSLAGARRGLAPALAVLAAASLLAAPLVRGGGSEPPATDPLFSGRGIPTTFSLPEAERDPRVPPPSEVIGHRIGDAITETADLVRYVQAVAAASPRVLLRRYGTTPEGRDLVLAVVSSPENLGRLSAIEKDLAALRDPRRTEPAAARTLAATTPAVVWVACGVHGDEPAGPEAGLALLYKLAASREEPVRDLLKALVVVIDPDVNPDGRARHVAFWRSVAGPEPDADPRALENDPPWPDGRTNHFGFDLNRDWAWATQPETRARLAALAALPPQVYLDLHEMGAESTFFFPPPAEPVHPVVPQSLLRWMALFGQANARAFDARGASYFSREVFDLFYPAYGDSWPTFHGTVGMTFESGAAGGLAHRRKDGRIVTLKERALSHFTAVSATLATAAERKAELLSDHSRFFRSAVEEGSRVFVVPAGQDRSRLTELAHLLASQGIEVGRTTRTLPGAGRKGTPLPAGSLVVDTAQPQGRFATVVLEPQAVLPAGFLAEERLRLLEDRDERFFDVTAWSLPMAFGLESAVLPSRGPLGSAVEPWRAEPPARTDAAPAYGWLLAGDDGASRLAAGRLLLEGVKVLATTRELRLSGRTFARGSFLVRRENNDPETAGAAVARVVEASGAVAVPLASAATETGPYLGSRTLLPLRKPRVVILTGDGADVGNVGALRLALERGLGVTPTLRRASRLGSDDRLDDTTVVVVPHGNATFRRALLDDESAAALERWVKAGGVVVGVRGGAQALRQKPLSLSEAKGWEAPKPREGEAEPAGEPPATPEKALEAELDRRELQIPGAALRTQATPDHPFLSGLASSPAFVVFDGQPVRRLRQARANVVSAAPQEPLASGFGWKEALDRWRGAPLVLHETAGGGAVVTFATDPVFRGVWRGSEAVFLNAVLLAPSL